MKDLHGLEQSENESDKWCYHPLGNLTKKKTDQKLKLFFKDGFGCNVPQLQIEWMKHIRIRNVCAPAIECMLKDPQDSILQNINKDVPYNSYYTLRIIAELFPIIIHMLLNISIVIATRETSVGRGNIGHQWAFYPIGVLVFASVLGVINHGVELKSFLIPMIVFPVTMFLCALVVLFSR